MMWFLLAGCPFVPSGTHEDAMFCDQVGSDEAAELLATERTSDAPVASLSDAGARVTLPIDGGYIAVDLDESAPWMFTLSDAIDLQVIDAFGRVATFIEDDAAECEGMSVAEVWDVGDERVWLFLSGTEVVTVWATQVD